MYPTRTTYHLACTPAEYKRCHAFFRAEAAHPQREADQLPGYASFSLAAPTVFGLRDEKIVGVIGTQYHPEYGLVASPLHVAYDIKNHVPVAIRLTDCYEAILREAGIPEYLILLPAWKPSKRIFSELRHGELVGTLPSLRLELYRMTIGS